MRYWGVNPEIQFETNVAEGDYVTLLYCLSLSVWNFRSGQEFARA